MVKSSRLYYLNPLFDLALGGYTTAGHVRTAAEMGCLFMPVAASGDMLLLDVSVPDDYRAYYRACGIDCPQILPADERCKSCDGVAWGWNGEAVARLTGVGARCSNPDPAIVKKVNARRFSFSINRKTGTGISGTHRFSSMKELHKGLLSWKAFPLVIKPDHGNAGYGFIRKIDTRLTDKESVNLDALFSSGAAVYVEPWLNRIADISSMCDISPKGGITGIRHYRSIQSGNGSFVADIIDPHDPVIEKWRSLLDEAASNCALKLHHAGYFGPAGFDSFTYTDDSGNEQLARIIEINARQSMGAIAFALYDKLAPKRVAMLRFMTRKRYLLPATYDALFKSMGDDAFHKECNRGAFLVTPLRVAHEHDNWIQPGRSAIFLAAESAEKLFEMDTRIRNVFLESVR